MNNQAYQEPLIDINLNDSNHLDNINMNDTNQDDQNFRLVMYLMIGNPFTLQLKHMQNIKALLQIKSYKP